MGDRLDDAVELTARLLGALGTVVLGQERHLRVVVAGVLAGGHILLEDAPGVGKTVLAKSLARALGGTAGRVQGTADLLPSDITGVTTYDQATGEWRFRPGPVFHHVLLVDEVNRATPRAQSALLEAMAEGAVTVDGTTTSLPVPFTVLATQNPLGDVGTHPLVGGQLDRFAVAVSLGLPGRAAERALLAGTGGTEALETLEAVTTPAELSAAQAAVGADVVVSPLVLDYVLDLAEVLRAHAGSSRSPSPRAVLTLLSVARAHAVVAGRHFVAPDDVREVAVAVLAHRLHHHDATSGEAIVSSALDSVPVPVG